jgi:hypothetical protein
MITLGKPRPSSFPFSSSFAKDPKNHHLCFTLPLSTIKILYILPIVLSTALEIVVKFNILHLVRFTDIAVPILSSILLMILCVEQQIEYWPEDRRSEVSMYASTVKLAVAAMLFGCIQDNRLFDDLKAFSTLPDPLASATLCGSAMLLTLAIGISRSETSLVEEYTETRQTSVTFVRRLLVDVCVSAAGCLNGILLRLPITALPIAAIGPVAIAEYYQRIQMKGKSDTNNYYTNLLIGILAAVSAAALALCYGMETVFFYTFSFHVNSYDIDLRYFCLITMVFTGCAVLIPTLLYSVQTTASTRFGGDWEGFLPVSMTDHHASDTSKAGVFSTFQMIFSLSSSALAGLELLVWEQVNLIHIHVNFFINK